jgi:DNA-binding response OmpR family regulator
MRAVLRRSNGPRHPRLDVRLVALAEDPERVFKKEELLRNVWGFRSLGRTRTLDSHASRLRRKLNRSPETAYILNVWGVGYRLVATAG